MALYDDDGSNYAQSTKNALRALSDVKNYGFTDALKEANISYFKATFGKAADWQLHHIIPQEIITSDSDVAKALQDLTREKLFSIRDGVN